MRHIIRNLGAALAAASCTVSPALAQEVPQILSDAQTSAQTPLPDFSYAGYGFGIKPIPQVKAVINVSEFEAGRYILAEILWLERSAIVLSGLGSGKGGTEIYMPRPLDQRRRRRVQ